MPKRVVYNGVEMVEGWPERIQEAQGRYRFLNRRCSNGGTEAIVLAQAVLSSGVDRHYTISRMR